jgi:SAM-dependent methyltransferase
MGSVVNPEQSLDKFLGTNAGVGRYDPPVHGVIAALDLKPGSVVVEIGAGSGHFTIPMARWLDGQGGDGVVFGFDLSPALVQRLVQAAVDGDLDRRVRARPISDPQVAPLPIRDASVDRVLAVNALHYLADPLPAYMEIARVLKPGGFALLVDWQRVDAAARGSQGGRRADIQAVALDLLATGLLVPSAAALPGFAFCVRAVRRSSEPIAG